jgi:lysophospholipase L1-like esterase
MKHAVGALTVSCVVSVWMIFPGCAADGGGNPATPTPESGTFYTAIGASDSVGVGSSSPCTTQACPEGTGWVPVLARRLGATLTNLGISGAVIGPDIQSLGLRYGRSIPGNYIDQEVRLVPRNTTLVTIFAGPNDINAIIAAVQGGAAGADVRGFLDSQIRAFGSNFDRLLSGVRNRVPSAKIVVANLPNFAWVLYTSPLETRQMFQRLSIGFSTEVINKLTTQGVIVVDVLCNSRGYDSTFVAGDGFHANDAGYAFFADEMYKAITQSSYPAPQASCPEMTLLPPL